MTPPVPPAHMMTADEIRTVAVDRLTAVNGSCNPTHIAHNDGVLRGLIWTLTGHDPGTELTRDTLHIFHLLGISAKRERDGITYQW